MSKQITPKYAMTIQRNYEMFKETLSKFCRDQNLSHEETDKRYLYAKAELYNIDITDFADDLDGLKQAVDALERNVIQNTINVLERYAVPVTDSEYKEDK